MSRTSLGLFVGGLAVLTASVAAFAAIDTAPTKFVSLNQGVDAATLQRYHYTDQGTRLLPAAWLAALRTRDGRKFMSPENLRQYGFIVDNIQKDAMNPYGWPVGISMSRPQTTGGIAIAGFTCAMCHTGELDYKGTAVRIEGGQAMIDLPVFVDAVEDALYVTATDRIRRAAFFAEAIAAGYPASRMKADFQNAVVDFGSLSQKAPSEQITQLETGRGRLDAVQGIGNRAFGTDLVMPGNVKDLDAPVNYPYLWDIGKLSWLQYNGFLPPLSTSRNIGEVIGTNGITHMVDPDTGVLNPLPERWRTSVQLDNILWMENTVVDTLRAPTWPADVFGPIDQAKADKGRQLFATNCAGCHGVKTLPDGHWDVSIVPLSKVGTDPGQATNWAGRTYDASKLGLSKQTPAAVGLAVAVNAMRKQLYADNKTPVSEQEPDVTFEAPCGYKARPLIGVWATPPFLHNGSVRTIYDLLSDTRPGKFTYGSKEYDPVKLGYTEDPSAETTVLDTSVAGNLNAGHWFTDDTTRPGRIGPKLSEDDKFAIMEFLKSATYDNYPTVSKAAEGSLPCSDNPNWAMQASAAATSSGS